MHIIIDGYNLIFAVSEFEQIIDRKNLETARAALLMALSPYKEKTRQELTVVFDGRDKPGDEHLDLSQKQLHEGITVVFSKGTTADEDIMDLIGSSQNPKNTCIVTSDKKILRSARSSGCKVAEPREFFERITPRTGKRRTSPHAEPALKYQEVSEEQVGYWLKIFQQGKKGGGGIKPR